MTTIYDSRASVPLKWMVEVPQLIKEMVEGNPSGGTLRRPAQIMLALLAQVAERAAVIDDPTLNDLMIRLALYEMAPDQRVKAADEQRLRAAKKLTSAPHLPVMPEDRREAMRELEVALREVRDAIMRADPEVLTDTLWMPEDVCRGATVVDRIDAALEKSRLTDYLLRFPKSSSASLPSVPEEWGRMAADLKRGWMSNQQARELMGVDVDHASTFAEEAAMDIKRRDPGKVLAEAEEFKRMIADLQLDRLPAGHTIIEAADLVDSRVSQTVRVERTGEEYERIVHSEEAYAHQYDEEVTND